MIIKGIDVSVYQGDIDWQAVKDSGIEFAILRVGYGSDIESQDDEKFFQNANECTRVKMPFGVYLFSYADTYEKINSEVDHTLRMINGYKLDYPVFLDLEDNATSKSVGSDVIADFARIYCTRIQEAGYSAAIYASRSWFEGYLTNSEFNNWCKWMACYYYNDARDNDANPDDYANTQYEMWQYSSSGNVNGINGRVDMNYCYKDYTSNSNNGGGTSVVENIDELINYAYNRFIGRNPDDGGMENWRNYLNDGNSRESFISEITNSDDSKNFIHDTIFNTYKKYFDRYPKSEEDGITFWTAYLLDENNTLESFDNEINRSQEHIDIINAFLNQTYHDLLNRDPDEEGVRGFTTAIIDNKMTFDWVIEYIKNTDIYKDYQNEIAKNEAINNAKNELDAELSLITDTSYYSVTFDDNTKLYTLTSNYPDDDSNLISADQESARVSMKDAYDKYNNTVSSL